jgi:hypothetical protein
MRNITLIFNSRKLTIISHLRYSVLNLEKAEANTAGGKR